MTFMNLDALREPFAASDIEWRLQQAGEKNGRVWALAVPYITNRAIMNRLDEICGAGNWRNEFTAVPGAGFLCGLSVRVHDEWVTKWDGAEHTDIEPLKGALSGAMKRAAVQWGIGRYLYELDEFFAVVTEDGAHRGKTKDGKSFRWNPPALPDWALPAKKTAAAPARKVTPAKPDQVAEAPATEVQVMAIRAWMEHPHITDTERAGFEARIAKGLSMSKAETLRSWLQGAVEARAKEAATELVEV